jgi:hypothetical protein
MGKKSRSGSWINIPDHISESLGTSFWVKILKFFDAGADPDLGIFLILDLGLKKFGSGINIPIRNIDSTVPITITIHFFLLQILMIICGCLTCRSMGTTCRPSQTPRAAFSSKSSTSWTSRGGRTRGRLHPGNKVNIKTRGQGCKGRTV